MDITRLCHRRSLLFSPRFQAGPGIEPGPAFRLATEGKETCSVPDDDADGTVVVKDERCPHVWTARGMQDFCIDGIGQVQSCVRPSIVAL